MIVLVDMDDVLEHLVVGWCEYLNSHYGTNVKMEDINDWNIKLAFPTLTREQIFSAEYDDSLWDLTPPVEGADEALRKILADGHEVYVTTATVYQSLKAKMEKILFKYYPYIDWSHVIITENKHLVKGDVLIDDGPHNLMGGSYRKILMDRPWNRSFDEKAYGCVRVHNWEEAYAEVCRIAKES